MSGLREAVRRLASGLVLLGSVGMMLSMLICVADVVGINFFGWPVPGTLEITESTMVLIVFGALAYTQQKRGHIRVDVLHAFAGPRVKAFMDAVTHALAFAFFILLAWESFGELAYSWEIRESTMGAIRFPLYPARLFLSAGSALLAAQLGLDVVADLARMLGGELAEAPVATDKAS